MYAWFMRYGFLKSIYSELIKTGKGLNLIISGRHGVFGARDSFSNPLSLLSMSIIIEIKTMNVQKTSNVISACDVPLPKRRK